MSHRLLSFVRMAAAVAVVSWIMGAPALAGPLRNHPVTLTQPNGAVLRCFVSGDEYFNWIHDAAGYTIIPDPNTGYYTYAVLEDGVPRASQYVVGGVDPAAAGLQRNALPRRDKIVQMLEAFPGPPVETADELHNAPRTGTINNLVVFIRFSGETDFPAAIGTYDAAFNSATSGANSMRNYFQEASYTQLTTSSTFYPAQNQTYTVSFQDPYARSYYQPYNVTTNPNGYQGGDNGTERRDREHALLAAALNAIASLVPVGLQLDGDGDGNIDNICFVVRGEPTGWSSLLWPHKWSLYSQTVNINGKRAYVYNFQLESAFGVSVLCHEMFHSIGAPDLYHYAGNGINPVYTWDLMEYNLNPPQHMSAYMKFKYGGWIASIPTISAAGTYTLNPLTSATGNAYRINSPYSSSEYFVVEFRRRIGTFESSLSGEGILVYRINTTATGNANGPPDEVYVYRPGGTPTANGTPANANFSAGVGRTAINDSTNPYSFLTAGGPGGLSLSNITSVGATMSFAVDLIFPPSVSINDVSVTEGQSGTTNAVFTVTLSAASSQVVTVAYATADNTATVAGNDYTAASGTLTFPAGTTTQPVTVVVKGDTLVEPTEAFYVNLTTPVNAAIVDGQGVGTITNDDGTRGDFTGDGKSDVLWRHVTRGEVWLWPMDGATRVSETYVRTVADTNWEIRGLGDQTGDGKADILWRNKTTGMIYFWPMDGSAPLDEIFVATVDPAYDIVGTGDYNGDGKSDILWRHLTNGEVWIWLMDGATPLSMVHVDTVDPSYVIKGSGDVDGDHKADIVWHHGTLGEVWVWLMNGTVKLSENYVATVPDVGYQIVGVADHTGDGKADILWHHATRGEVWVWLMNGATRLSQTWVATVPDVGYRIVGAGDYNGDSKADILWHYATRGEVWVWLMDGAVKLSENQVAAGPDVGYQVVKVK